jgi:hypothetical protein
VLDCLECQQRTVETGPEGWGACEVCDLLLRVEPDKTQAQAEIARKVAVLDAAVEAVRVEANKPVPSPDPGPVTPAEPVGEVDIKPGRSR